VRRGGGGGAKEGLGDANGAPACACCSMPTPRSSSSHRSSEAAGIGRWGGRGSKKYKHTV